MKDLIDYSGETCTGPMESLENFPRRPNPASGFHGQQQTEEQQQQQQPQQQTTRQSLNNGQTSVQDTSMQVASSNGLPSANNSLTTPLNTSSTSAIVGLLHQNSMNGRQQNPMNNPSTFLSPIPSLSNNGPLQTSHGSLSAAAARMSSGNSPNVSVQQLAISGDADQNGSHSSVQKIIHEMMVTSQLNGGGAMAGAGTLGNDVKNVNGISTRSNSMGGNGGIADCNVGNGGGFGGVGGGIGQAAMVNGIQAAMGNNSRMTNGRAPEQNMNHQQQALGDPMLSELGVVNGFDDLQFDWKSSP